MDKLQILASGEKRRIKALTHIERSSPYFIPITLTGGIGDSILCPRSIEYLEKMGYEPVIYTRHYEAVRYFNKTSNIISGAIPDFTWHLELDSIARFVLSDTFEGFLNSRHKYLFDLQQRLFMDRPDVEYLVKQHPKYKYVIEETFPVSASQSAIWSLTGHADELVPDNRKSYPEKYITIHDGYDVNSATQVTKRSTKQWPIDRWNDLILKLKRSYPDYKIIQLGSSTSEPISSVNLNLINKTTITQAFDILSKSALHIDTDSGLVHAATKLGVPCVVIFGPTPVKFYGHDQNINITSNKSCSGGCFFLTDDWMNKCPIGYDTPVCMIDVTSEQVLEAIKEKAPRFLV